MTTMHCNVWPFGPHLCCCQPPAHQGNHGGCGDVICFASKGVPMFQVWLGEFALLHVLVD